MPESKTDMERLKCLWLKNNPVSNANLLEKLVRINPPKEYPSTCVHWDSKGLSERLIDVSPINWDGKITLAFNENEIGYLLFFSAFWAFKKEEIKNKKIKKQKFANLIKTTLSLIYHLSNPE